MSKKITAWQLTMLALGTVIGGSFFLGSSIAIKSAGPAILLAYLLGGGLVYIILFSLSEMAVAKQATGSFRTYCEDIYGPLAGFIVGWVYWTGLVLAMSSEAIAVSLFIRNWFPDLSLPLLGTLIITGITLTNLLGVDKLSKLESSLSLIKLLALIGFIFLAILLIAGLLPEREALGLGHLETEKFLPGGIGGIAGSMLIVMFTYAGFEIIGLAATEARNPHQTIPRAITYTVISLVGIYVLAITVLLPLIPTDNLSEEASPLVTALLYNNLGWAGNIINLVMISAILSTMLAATFGIARMARSLAETGHAPGWLKDKGDIPYKGITFSGLAMLAGLALGFILPRQVYLFLVSSGGFALLFVYLIILLTHYRFRKIYGCPPRGKCRLPGYPYTTWAAILGLLAIIISMPLIEGQGSGLIAGLLLVSFYFILYIFKNYQQSRKQLLKWITPRNILESAEFAEDLSPEKTKEKEKD
jgi:AAT family amino acid transporter